ncbi:MFS transporter [Actinocorallia longicatena]|uniref:MFS transporter n=1 Tax=Actinocorallia longicatena TaxID=111803 RepID=A0ABP6PZ75_9ACTN
MTAVPEQARLRYRDAFAVREFRAIFAAHVISFVGMIMAEFATTVLVYRKTGSPLLTSLVFALAFLPHLFAGTFLSSLVDRIPLRRLMTGCTLATAALAGIMAVPGMPVPALLLLVFMIGMVSPILGGARAATLPQVMPGPAYVPARSMLRVVTQSAQVFGLGAGGLLLTVIEPHTALLLEACAFVVAAMLLRFGTSERPPAPSDGTSMVKDSLSGIRDVLSLRPLRRNLLLGWTVSMLSVAPEALANPYAAEAGFDTARLGLMMAALPLGCTVGEFAGMWLMSPSRQVRLIAPLAAVVLVPLLGYALTPGIAGVMLILFVSGAGIAYHLGQDHHLLESTPEALRSRALALQTTGLMFFQGVGFAGAGAAGQFASVSVIVPVCAVLGLLALAALRPSPPLKA